MDIGIEKGTANLGKAHILKILFWIVVILLLLGFYLFFRVQTKYGEMIITPEQVEKPSVGLVFGAGLKAKGVPGLVLEDRVVTAVELYQQNRIGKFIMSGDNQSAEHNEVLAMKNLALSRGLPEDSLLLDKDGLSTLNSCQNVKEKFGLNKIVLITQKYHLKRALYLCNEAGIQAKGVAAKNSGYASQWKYSLREIPA
ncbi:MAG TPA: ElyC/SanA/YdcF family protein, partial [Patescibacteria group bacterium]|nr:ElyC/SanA/YdcF family protein [Patescibacteria group bacterium]